MRSTLKQFIPDHKRRNRNRQKRKLSDPYDYHCNAYDTAYDSAYDYDFRFALGFNTPNDYDSDCDAIANQAQFSLALNTNDATDAKFGILHSSFSVKTHSSEKPPSSVKHEGLFSDYSLSHKLSSRLRRSLGTQFREKQTLNTF